MKKEKLEYVILFLTVFLLIPFISSETNFGQIFGGAGGLEWLINGVKEAFAQIFGPILGHDVVDEFMFAKILLFILLFSIVYLVLQRIEIFSESKSIQVIISIIFGIFAVRYLKPNEIINAILLPYGGFAAALTIFLPLLVFFIFANNSNIGPFGRRAAWFIYGAVFLILWGMRPYTDLGTANWIYFLGLGFIIINLLFDRSIQRHLGLAGLERWRENVEDARIARLQVEYNDLASTPNPSTHIRRRMKSIERQLRRERAWPI